MNSTFIPKYVDRLQVPGKMAAASQREWINNRPTYQIAARQFAQQVLPSTGSGPTAAEPYPKTTVWGYGPSGQALSAFSWPAATIEAKRDEEIWVRWDNQLVDDPASAAPRFLAHLLPVDQTLLWANPPGPIDSRGTSADPYHGPVPLVTHLHGGHTDPESDGYPQSWCLPQASDLPSGYVKAGDTYGSVIPAPEGSAWYMYRNDQPAATLWYHDNTLGIARLNNYAGLCGMFLLRDDTETRLDLPAGEFEIPLIMQDRSFRNDGSLFYPESRSFFDGFKGPFRPATDIPPLWNPGFFGNTICVNGKTWPYLEVQPAMYRFLILNASESRVLILRFGDAGGGPVSLAFAQIGADGGFLRLSAAMDVLVLAPGERADVLVNFSAFDPGTEILMLNLGPDSPLQGLPVAPTKLADVETTGQVMKFRVMASGANSNRVPPVLPVPPIMGNEARRRELTFYENRMSQGFLAALFPGNLDEGPVSYSHPLTDVIQTFDTEVWKLVNLTYESHPIHVHQVQFEILSRIPFKAGQAETYAADQKAWIERGRVGATPNLEDYLDSIMATGPEPGETGRKDTVLAHPGQVVQIKAFFDIGGLYTWHSAILSSQDNEMQRPFFVES
jgi:FtsP/CotA-like multicopper oxidase with cupredoxin domain